jgi:2-(1,2-epoxy-1,2-dihydrophenyl)acetyl-CoA isomerase
VLDDSLLVGQDGGVLKLTLNRPDRLNSFNQPMQQALMAELARAANDPRISPVLLMSSPARTSAKRLKPASTR